MNPFFGRHTKKGSLWEKFFGQKQGYLELQIFLGKSHIKLSGKFGGLRVKIVCMPKNLLASTLMPRVWPKIFLQGGPRVAKFHFHH